MPRGKYRTIPVYVDAHLWDGTAEDADDLIDWLRAHDIEAHFIPTGHASPLRHRYELYGGEDDLKTGPSARCFIDVCGSRVDPGRWVVIDNGAVLLGDAQWFEAAYERVPLGLLSGGTLGGGIVTNITPGPQGPHGPRGFDGTDAGMAAASIAMSYGARDRRALINGVRP